jgi:hypothetical protein
MVGELRSFDVTVSFLHSHGEVDAAEGGVDDSGGQHRNEDVKSV